MTALWPRARAGPGSDKNTGQAGQAAAAAAAPSRDELIASRSWWLLCAPNCSHVTRERDDGAPPAGRKSKAEALAAAKGIRVHWKGEADRHPGPAAAPETVTWWAVLLQHVAGRAAQGQN